ncbi:DUF2175 domain-containing protein [Agaribacterium sp. ZY112]|uniref:DUF2175 domain-containing protein n=1 Tax=Agaribacterium sp. ZY112 TaxID=3233574 RepID=UPI0035233691
MKCLYCNAPVFGRDGITIAGKGPAHQKCYQADQALKRTFQHLKISELNDQELVELKDLILAEENDRKRSDDDDGIELF